MICLSIESVVFMSLFLLVMYDIVTEQEDLIMMSHNEEARYHFVLMDMVDLIGDYGYDTVMADLEIAIADKVNRLVSRAVLEDSEE